MALFTLLYSFRYCVGDRYKNKFANKEKIESRELNYLVSEFIRICDVDPSNYEKFTVNLIEFDSDIDRFNNRILKSDYIGLSFGINRASEVEIYINNSDWINLTFDLKKKLVYHELLHDIFDLKHIDDSCSIMNTALIPCNLAKLDIELQNIIKDEM